MLVNKKSKNGTYDLLNARDRENIYLIYSKIFLVHVASVLVSTLGRVVKRLRLSDSDEMKFALASFFVDRKKVELIGIKDFWFILLLLDVNNSKFWYSTKTLRVNHFVTFVVRRL